MFIILEGENKTGKSSLAKHIQKITGWEIVKFSQPKKEPYLEYIEFLLTRKEPAIIDRFHLGEDVYGPIWRGKSGLEDWQRRMIEMTLMARDTLNIYCETDEKTIIKNFEKEKEEFAKAEQIHTVISHFKSALKRSGLKWNTFDYQKDPKYAEIQQTVITWFAKFIQNKAYLTSLIDSRAIGNPYAKNVIVGDICNGDLELDKYKHVILPFAKGVSSDYLWKSIDKIPKIKYLLTNARKYHNEKKLDTGDIFNSYGQKIICLGNSAFGDVSNSVNGQLQLQKIVKVKHPAWGTRFAVDPELYALGIKSELI